MERKSRVEEVIKHKEEFKEEINHISSLVGKN